MCGICGYVGPKEKKLLLNMMKNIIHRGPDDSGFIENDDFHFGHKRLSIISPETGKQPISNENNTIWLVYNGEIYNYKKLKDKLEKSGHKFNTETDSEIIVHSYEEYGEDCVSYFNGQFAFAIWDSNKKKLFLARDRIGIKPLYFAFKKNTFYFASEIKAILQSNVFSREINYNAINAYLTYRFIPDQYCIFKEINKLPPAHTLTFENKKITTRQYWSLEKKEIPPVKNLIDEYMSLFEDAVKIRMMSDVPLGAFLSSGLDSNSIVSVMRNFTNKQIKTFSIGFNYEYNELPKTRESSSYLGTQHHERIITDDDLNLLPKILWHQDEPFGDALMIAVYILSGLAKEKVTVTLSGDGADELLGGYSHQKVIYLLNKYN